MNTDPQAERPDPARQHLTVAQFREEERGRLFVTRSRRVKGEQRHRNEGFLDMCLRIMGHR